jgi:single-stranded-DNA-specific exonuclease
LIITVDCGITDAFELDTAQVHGIEVIVTDHHTPPEIMPKAYAVLDPKQSDCLYPFKELCGAGVAFKFAEGFITKYGERFAIQKGWEKWLLDLVGIATLSDMVSLTGENRVFASYGLMVLRKTRRPGLLKLFSRMRMYRNGISEDDITFMVTPRINAASRLGKAEDAFRLLATDDDVEAGVLAEKLDKINDERKGIVAALVKELKHIAKERVEGKQVLVIGNPDWRPSLLGLAANSLVEQFNMPVFLWGRDGSDCVKGSCRGPEGVNVVSLMRFAAKEGVFDDFGGHHEAGGFRVADGKVHLLPESLEKAYDAVMSGPQNEPKNFVDHILSIEDVTMQTYRTVALLAPFGIGNEKPVFLFKSVPIVSVRVFGKQHNHLELSFQKFDDSFVKAIGFFTKPDSYGVLLVAGKVIDLVASLELSNFNGRSELRLRIVDII